VIEGPDTSARRLFGDFLRRQRLSAGLTQEELAERSGLSVRTVANMERGRTKRPYRGSVRSLADALALTDMQRQELNQFWRPAASISLTTTAGRPARERPHAPPVPRQLPPVIGNFTGRQAELAALARLIGVRPPPAGPPATVLITAIAGTAGVGKTALAVLWAHQIADRFPDGQLFMNLRGYDPAQPVPAGEALAGFLRALGVPGAQIPDGADERAGLYRSRLAGRRMLVVLDNARDGEHVRPLLPGDPGCAAVITSRDTLAGLVATDGARRLDLDALPLAEAVALLRSLIGPRADADPVATAELAGMCARLPLALRIAAELASARAEAPLARLVPELAAAQLDSLNAGEDRADVRAVFSWSLRQLPDSAADVFALMGLHPGEDLDVHAAAALTGTAIGQAGRVLGRLHRASLLQASGPGRYSLHDLLRAYALEQAAARDTGDRSELAVTRLFDYYLAASAAAMTVLSPAEAHLRPHIPPTGAAVPELPSEEDAREWLNRERANLAAVVVHCAGHSRPGYATSLAGTLFRYLMTGSHLPEAMTVYSHALVAARQSGDQLAEGRALNGLGSIAMMKGHFLDAAGHYQTALEIYRQLGDRARQASVLHNLGITQRELHDYPSAVTYFGQAIAAYEDAGEEIDVAIALSSLAAVEISLDSYDQAAEHLQLSLSVFREAKDQVREAEALSRMGRVSVRRGQLAEARAFFEQALTIYRRIDSPGNCAAQLRHLGDVILRQGDYGRAVDQLRLALAQIRQTGDQHAEILTLRSLAAALHGTGQLAAARAELRTALRLADETSNTYEQAGAHSDLASSHYQAGEDEQARYHWQQALDLYTRVGAPEAGHIRSELSGLEAGDLRGSGAAGRGA
jgi:tetratricopeptide (TPR) repeat protein/transcriptional regulator with XRE-family HTH domain